MPSSPSAPISGASSREGSVPCSYHSSTDGRIRSAAKRRTVSAIRRSSSERRPSRSSGSSGRTFGRVAVADMRASVLAVTRPRRSNGPLRRRPQRLWRGGTRARPTSDLRGRRTVESDRADMAVDTTVQVTLPQMGESVTEGTVLEWHKQEGDHVDADEVIVEVSTDKVDAEVPAPASGTVAKIHAAEGDTVQVGAVLAEIAPGNGSAPTRAPAAAPGNGGAAQATEEPTGNGAPPAEAEAADDVPAGETIDIVTPTAGESVSEGTLVEWHVAAGDTVDDGQPIAEISTDKVDVELPAPTAGTITEVLVGEGDTVTVGQVIARMTTATNGASAATPAQPAPAADESADGDGNGATRVAPAPIPSDAKVSPVAARIAAAEGIDLADVTGSGPGGRITKADVLATVANGGAPGPAAAGTPPARGGAPQPPRRGPGRGGHRAGAGSRAPAAARWRGHAREVHGREPVDPDRHLVPHACRHDDGRPAQEAEGLRPARLVHPPHRLRHRARGPERRAGDGAPLRRDRRPAAPRRRRPGEPRHRGRRREEGRQPPPHGAGHPRRRPQELPRLQGRLRRARREGAHEHADRRRPHRREHLADEPRRPRHRRVRPAPHGRPGHDRRDGLDRLSGRPAAHRRHDRRREGHDHDLDVRPPDHPGGRVGALPPARRGLPRRRERLLRRRLLLARRRARPDPRAARAGRRRRGRAH